MFSLKSPHSRFGKWLILLLITPSAFVSCRRVLSMTLVAQPPRSGALGRWVFAILLVVGFMALDSSAEALTPPPDVLPYTDAMVGLTSRAFAAPPQSSATAAPTSRAVVDGSIAVAVSALFYPGTTVTTLGLFAQTAVRRADGTASVAETYRVCYNEPFDLTVNDADGSTLALYAAADPFSCPSLFLRDLVRHAETDRPFGDVNLTAIARPFDPQRLLWLQLFTEWGLDLAPAEAFDATLQGATSGPVTLLADAAVAFCTAPGELRPGWLYGGGDGTAAASAAWSLRALFSGAYNVAVHVTAVQAETGAICGGAAHESGAADVSTGPLVYRMSGGRLDVVASLASSSAADGTASGSAVAADRDVVNATFACVAAKSMPRQGGVSPSSPGAAFLFVAGPAVWLVAEGAATRMTPDACWQTPSFARLGAWRRLVGRSYAGTYGALATVNLRIRGVVEDDGGTAAATANATGTVTLLLSGVIRTSTFSADCTGATDTPVVVDRASGVGVYANATACLGQALERVAASAWLRIEYIDGADAWWLALYGGAFLATRSA